ncbi:MAG TPA: Lsr2 family protein [Pseudonocardiaceae bacterium]|nr:Lsr2 family protein [Pseudonocardiaceae bacterium]
MASKTFVELFDDLDGGRADETVSFALDGVDYELDLSTAHAAELRKILGEYVAKAHKTPLRTQRARKSVARRGASMTAEIRRLASESARKVAEAQEAAEPAELSVAGSGPRPADQRRDDAGEPVHALIIPFQEAGL